MSERLHTEGSAGIPAQRLNALAGRIDGYRRKFEAQRDDRAIFAFVYAGITRKLAAALAQSPGEFEDPDWVVDLDIRFAEFFFAAMDAIDEALSDSAEAERRLGELQRFKPWVDTYRAIRGNRSTVLEALVFSMAAHIGLDLPQALAEVKMERAGRSCLADYQMMNGFLREQIDFIQRSAGDRYNRALKFLDKWAGRYDELFTNYGIRTARSLAWYNAQRLLNESTRDAAQSSIENGTGALIELVRRPKSRVVRVLLWSARAAVRLFRKWPRPQEASPAP